MSNPIRVAVAAAAVLLAGPAAAQLAKGTVAPAFEFAKVWNDGPASFDELQGKLVVLEFFATW
ncbi:MAG: hypothetical protein IT457_03100 [Planctomycetes bacterium]|jgi:hypothetical protein|nr:hypothetical protein [Planctomycetota bacterium]